MKRPIPLLTLLALFSLASILPTSVRAQEAELGPLQDVMILKVSPETLNDYMEVLGMLKEAAVAANLDAQWGWDIWVRDFEISIVAPVTDRSLLFDNEAWMNAFAGTPGEEMLAAAFERYQADVRAMPVSREIWELEDAWSYLPEEPGIGEVKFSELLEIWVKPGKEEAFEEISVEVQEFLTKLAGPFPTYGHRVWFGDVGRVVYAILLEDWADYLGERSFEAGLAQSGLAEEWQALMARFMECITESTSSRWTYLADLSYQPGG